MLSGYKTYVAAALLVLVTGLAGAGLITHDTAELVMGLLAAAGLTTARKGASNDAAAALDDAKDHVAAVVPSAAAAKGGPS